MIRQRDPCTPYLPIPKQLQQALYDWAPKLAEYPQHRAMTQYDLFGTFQSASAIDGLVLPWERVAGFYGDTPDMLKRKRSYTTFDLIRLYRADVDPAFTVSSWDYEKGLARVITHSGIPEDIRRLSREAMLDPFGFDDWVCWITEASANRRNHTAAITEQRMNEIMNQETTIESPQPLLRIQEYLNGLPSKHFSHGGYGVVSRLSDAINAAQRAGFTSESARDGEIRKLYWMKHFPKPLYKRCDRFPRLKADPYNQLMNLTSDLRPHLYTDNDVELDLSKAHMAAYVPVAKRLGLDVPKLEACLTAALDGERDLWDEVAAKMDADVMTDAKARRKAAKTCYSIVYGSSENNTLYRMIERYADLTGDWHTHEPVSGTLTHDALAEVLDVRDAIRDHINKAGGLEDAFGRFIPLTAWDGVKNDANRWRGVLAYVNCSYELALIYEVFKLAIEEQEWADEKKSRRERFKVWLLQGDGLTIRIDRKQKHEPILDKLQAAVKAKADELGMTTALERA